MVSTIVKINRRNLTLKKSYINKGVVIWYASVYYSYYSCIYRNRIWNSTEKENIDSCISNYVDIHCNYFASLFLFIRKSLLNYYTTW